MDKETSTIRMDSCDGGRTRANYKPRDRILNTCNSRKALWRRQRWTGIITHGSDAISNQGSAGSVRTSPTRQTLQFMPVGAVSQA